MKYRVWAGKKAYILVETNMGWWLKARSKDIWVGRNLSDAMQAVRKVAGTKKPSKLAALVQTVIGTFRQW
jgi:hypothetical protein